MRPSLLVEKRKWDGSVSTRWTARRIEVPAGAVAWSTPAGTPRDRPRRGEVDVTGRDQITVAPGGWWIVTGHGDGAGGLHHYLVDAVFPPEEPADGHVCFVDLDIDLRLRPGDGAGALEDVEQFHQRARTMGYPAEVCRGAWEGLAGAELAYRRGDWPFDGWIEEMLRVASAVGGSA